MADSALLAKVVCLVLFAVISLACGLLPLAGSRLLRRWRRRHGSDKPSPPAAGWLDLLISCLLCLGGGVLLGTVFTHMMPEIREVFARVQGAGLLPGMEPSAGETFLCVGFFLVYLVEELVHAFLAGRSGRKRSDSLPLAAPPPVESPAAEAAVHVHGDREAMSWNEHLYRTAVPAAAAAPVAAVAAAAAEADHGHDHGAAIGTLHAFRAYMVVMALSVHSVFEGFAVAFETTSRDVWILFAAIATHKGIVSFCLGEQLVSTKRSTCFIVTSLLLLASASPLGVTIGLFVEQLDQDESSQLLCTAVLQSLAAGTILYVVFFEILGPERQKRSSGLLKFLAVVAGFALIVLVHSTGGHSHGAPAHQDSLQLPTGHSHGHGHGHGHGPAGRHEHAQPSSDYLARVPNESGHVLDTVRYIKSFRRQDRPDVDREAIIDSMRSVVRNLAGAHAAATVDARPAHGGRDLPERHGVEGSSGEHAPHGGEEDHHHADGVDPAGGEGDSAHAAHSGGEEEHHHDHVQFMRTVADLAGRLDGVSRQAVNRAVSLMDRLDLIATQNTHGRQEAGGLGEPAGHGHGGGHEAAAGHRDLHWLHSEPAGGGDGRHLHFVLQDHVRRPPEAGPTAADRHGMSEDAERELRQIQEVRFHGHEQQAATAAGGPPGGQGSTPVVRTEPAASAGERH